MRNHSRIGRLVAIPAIAGLALVLGASPAAAHESHTVASGETLGHIALKYGVSVDAIAAENGISNPNRIRVGQVLSIPHGSGSVAATVDGPRPVDPAAFSGGSGSYTVQPGRFPQPYRFETGCFVEGDRRQNGLAHPYVIGVGQTLKVPGSVANYPNLPQRILDDPPVSPFSPASRSGRHTTVSRPICLMAVAWQESGWRNDRVLERRSVRYRTDHARHRRVDRRRAHR